MKTGTFSRLFLIAAILAASAAPLAAQFEQTNQLYFTMVQGGASPVPQVLPVANGNTGFYFSATPSTFSGGNWLAVLSGNLYAPASQIVSIDNTVASTLTAGSYSGQVAVKSSSGTETVPVTLTVVASNQAQFANLPGGLTFGITAGGQAGAQVIQIENAGPGTLNWGAQASTFSGSSFLTVSATSGTAPSFLTVGVAAQNLPGGGSTLGTFVGQILLTSSTGSVTIPVAVSVGGTHFVQVNPLRFSMPQGGAAPLPQVIPGASSGSTFYFASSEYTGTGGNWLTVPSNNFYIPDSPVVSFDQAVVSALPAGVYTGEVIINPTSTGTFPTMVVP